MKKLCLTIGMIVLATVQAQAEDKYTSAIKIATLSIYVEKNCIGLEPDKVMIGTAMQSMGVDPKELVTDARLRQANLIMQVWARGGDNTCTAAKKLFGPSGSDISGLFVTE